MCIAVICIGDKSIEVMCIKIMRLKICCWEMIFSVILFPGFLIAEILFMRNCIEYSVACVAESWDDVFVGIKNGINRARV